MKQPIKQKLIRLAGAVLLPLAALTTSPVTQAIDAKLYSGGQCMALNGSQVKDFGNFVRGFYNQSSGYRIATCALTRDNAYGTGGLSYGYAYVTPQFSHQTTTCTIITPDQTGNNYYYKTNSRTGAGWIYLGGGAPDSESYYYGSIVVYCSLPSKGFLNHIEMREDAGTDAD